MLCHSFMEFIFIYDHNIGRILSGEQQGGFVLKFNIVKDLQESSRNLTHERLIFNDCNFHRRSWHGLRFIFINNPDRKFAVINKGEVYVCWQLTKLTTVQDEGVTQAVTVTRHNLHLQFICEIMQQARIEVITERD